MNFLPRTRGGALWRFALAGVLVIILTATTTAVGGLLKVHDIVISLDQTPSLRHADVTLPPPGAPQTLLLIGSDHRAGTSYSSANTDTMMLVRVDDSSSTINVLSIPRDLAVMLPSGGTEYEGKLNAAYSIGGPNQLIQTLKQQVFPGLQINHILDVNFAGFADLVDAIGCVYADVDHRYYNNTALTDYSSIDIQPGYQKLCGGNNQPNGALAFVRFRHTDSDVVRNARQQDFLRWAKEGYSADQLVGNEQKLIQIFGAHVQTDHSLHTTDGLLELFDLIVNADGHTIKSIPFPEYFGACGGTNAQTPCYVYADGSGPGEPEAVGQATSAESQAYQRFLTPTAAAPASSAKSASVSHPPKPKMPTSAVSDAGLTADPADGSAQAAALGDPGIPVYYPTYIATGGLPLSEAGYCSSTTGNCDDPEEPESEYDGSYPRKYVIHARNGTPERAYVMTLMINSALGEYYTVQGTTWQDPPIFNAPKRVVTADGKKLFAYYDANKVALVAWHTSKAVYWVSNTLDNSIPNGQMLAMAASLTLAK